MRSLFNGCEYTYTSLFTTGRTFTLIESDTDTDANSTDRRLSHLDTDDDASPTGMPTPLPTGMPTPLPTCTRVDVRYYMYLKDGDGWFIGTNYTNSTNADWRAFGNVSSNPFEATGWQGCVRTCMCLCALCACVYPHISFLLEHRTLTSFLHSLCTFGRSGVGWHQLDQREKYGIPGDGHTDRLSKGNGWVDDDDDEKAGR